MSLRSRGALLAATGLTAALAVLGSGVVAAPTAAATPTITGDACPRTAPAGSLRGGSADLGVYELCREAVAAAPTTQAKRAIRAALHMLGAPYACDGAGRMAAFRFDCSSLVSRAYSIGAGIAAAGPNWAYSTREMVPWGGGQLADWLTYVRPADVRPGDLVLYDTGGATYRHVAMYLGNGFMVHTSHCGDTAHVTSFWGFGASSGASSGVRFLVARRAVLPGQPRSVGPQPAPSTPTPKPSPSAVAPFPGPLRVGSTGAAVASLQRALIRRGYDIPALSSGQSGFGSFGQQTAAAVVQFQRHRGGSGSSPGVVDAALYRAITAGPGAAPRPRGTSSSGSTGASSSGTVSLSRVLAKSPAAVKVVQAGLNKVVDAGLPTNGKWGPLTQAAFDSFRRGVMRMTGANATGAPGMASLRALGQRAGFRVVA